MPGSEHFCNEQRFQVETQPGVLMRRIDENLFFADIAAVVDRMQAELAAQGVVLHLAEVKGPVLDRLRHSPWLAQLPEPPFVSGHAAALALDQSAAAGGLPRSLSDSPVVTTPEGEPT